MPSSSSLPPDYLQYRVVYRHPPADEPLRGVTACGFMQKPSARGAQYDAVYNVYVAVYLLRGTGRYIDQDGTVIPLGPGDLIQRLPGRWHSTVQDANGLWAECFLELHPKAFSLLGQFGMVETNQPVLRPGLDLSIAGRFDALLHLLQTGTETAMSRAYLHAQELLVDLTATARLRQGGRREKQLVEQACQMINNDPGSREELPVLAEALELSYDRFRKLFREQMGITPGEYRIHRRIDAARALLLQGELSIKEIAAQLGYPDVYVFSKQFRAIVGMAPGQFRKQAY